MAQVLPFGYLPWLDLIPKARPTRAGIVFRLGVEQGLSARDTMVNAGNLAVPVFPGKSSFGTTTATVALFIREMTDVTIH